MKYSLGFVLDRNTSKKIDLISSEVAKIFRGQEIPVRWGKSGQYYILLHNYNNKISFIKKFFIKKKLDKIGERVIEISLHRIKLGISKRMKDLIYLSIDSGGEELRNLKSILVERMHIKDSVIFIPHIVIGRISKDVTRQEASNIVRDFENLQERINGVTFEVNNLELIEHNIDK